MSQDLLSCKCSFRVWADFFGLPAQSCSLNNFPLLASDVEGDEETFAHPAGALVLLQEERQRTVLRVQQQGASHPAHRTLLLEWGQVLTPTCLSGHAQGVRKELVQDDLGRGHAGVVQGQLRGEVASPRGGESLASRPLLCP